MLGRLADLQRLQPAHRPGGFREVLEIAASYKLANGQQVPLWVTENGIADDEDTKRPSYIVSHIAVVRIWSRTAWISAATPTGRSWTASSGWKATTSSSASMGPTHHARTRAHAEEGQHRRHQRNHEQLAAPSLLVVHPGLTI